ncbi:unnamed protein product [Spirodela intermedia]|uniref:Uncharacterized protein n=1 Tax=Spirodela intermedia TaxID=51605 RepID=A0A7I8JBU1_SPIIN|nr:unnamed protein product [Spirodela intermedia]CAA6667205.1 unnamed protein product [Spirodela intermedia]
MWKPGYGKGGDLEAGEASVPLYPMMLESPDLRWAFIRKVYSILSIQLLLTAVVSAVVVSVHPISHFFVSSGLGLAVYIVIVFLTFIPPPVNLFLLAIFTVAISIAVGLTCAFTKGKEGDPRSCHFDFCGGGEPHSLHILGARRGQDFSFLGPFLFGALLVLIVFGFIQIFFPLGKISTMIYGAVAAILFCGYIIYDTDNLIKRHTYDEYILASVALYLDVVNLFLYLLTIFRAADS